MSLPKPPQLLIVEDDADVALAAQLLLRRQYRHLTVLHDPAKVPAFLAHSMPDLVLLDLNFAPGRIDGEQGLALLDHFAALPQPPAVIVMTAYADVPLAVAAVKRGAQDFITKPWDNDRLLATIAQALASRRQRSAPTSAMPELLGDSPAMHNLRQMIASVAPTLANVMILGENGVGKELVARALHQLSPRAGKAMLTVDMGSLPEATVESELFGHRKGAFTDAKADRLGRFQAAHGGTLFLDEIGNVPLATQAKLLTALERREVTPVGADKAEAVDVRIISATNLSELALFDPQVFRTDLLFRLNTIVLRVPALRERQADVPQLLAHYLRHYEVQYQRVQRPCADGVAQALSNMPWPGNVRALRHACERAVILAQQTQYQIDDFATSLGPTAPAPTTSPTPASTPANFSLEAMERETIVNALAQVQGNISHAAKLLGLSRAALYRKLARYGL